MTRSVAFLHHPKVLSYGLDKAYTQRDSLATSSAPAQDEPAPGLAKGCRGITGLLA